MSELSSTSYPVLPLRDIVVFPHLIVPLFVGREKSVRALEAVMKDDKQILLASQKDAAEDEPKADSIYRVGVLANVLQLLKLPDGTVKVLVEGKARVRITKFLDNDAYFEAEAESVPETERDAAAIKALSRAVAEEFERYAKLNRNIPEEAVSALSESIAPDKLADTVAGHLGVKLDEKQKLLEEADVGDRLEAIYGLMQGEMSVLKVEKKIKRASRRQMERDPARVLSQRADEGDPARARRRGRRPGRRLRVRGAHRQDQALQGSAREGDRRAEEAPLDVADVGRGHRRAQLPRVDAVDPVGQEVEDQEGSPPRPEGPRRRPLRPREGQGPHRRVPRRPVALGEAEGPDPLPRRPSRRRQDLARQVGRQGHGPRVHPHLARRRPGRGGDPWPPAHLHRLDARQDHPVDEEGQDHQPPHPARRDRQDGPGLPRRPGARPCSRCSTPSRTPPSRTTTSRSSTTSRT